MNKLKAIDLSSESYDPVPRDGSCCTIPHKRKPINNDEEGAGSLASKGLLRTFYHDVCVGTERLLSARQDEIGHWSSQIPCARYNDGCLGKKKSHM